MLRGEALEQRVRVLREANLERPVRLVGADAVEHEDAARAFDGDEAREFVAQRAWVLIVPGVEQVVTVE